MYVGVEAAEFRGPIFEATVEAETKYGRPVCRNEVSAHFNSIRQEKLHPHVVQLLLQDLWRNDELLADKEVIFYSARPEMQD